MIIEKLSKIRISTHKHKHKEGNEIRGFGRNGGAVKL